MYKTASVCMRDSDSESERKGERERETERERERDCEITHYRFSSNLLMPYSKFRSLLLFSSFFFSPFFPTDNVLSRSLSLLSFSFSLCVCGVDKLSGGNCSLVPNMHCKHVNTQNGGCALSEYSCARFLTTYARAFLT